VFCAAKSICARATRSSQAAGTTFDDLWVPPFTQRDLLFSVEKTQETSPQGDVGRIHVCSVILALLALFSMGCNNGTNTDMSYKAAINDHFKAYPVCIWSQSKKFPVQAATSDDAKTEGCDALTQEGLLTRTTAKKKVLVASKQVNNYDLSEKGRASWTRDSTQPGTETSVSEIARSLRSTIRPWALAVKALERSQFPITTRSRTSLVGRIRPK
jgi:hypothetical protein